MKTSLRGPVVSVVTLSVALAVVVEVRPGLTRVALETWAILVAAGIGLVAWRLAWRGLGAHSDRRRPTATGRPTPGALSSPAIEVDRLLRRATAPEETSVRLALAARLERLTADLGLPLTETDPHPIRADVPLDLDRLGRWLDQADAWVDGRRPNGASPAFAAEPPATGNAESPGEPLRRRRALRVPWARAVRPGAGRKGAWPTGGRSGARGGPASPPAEARGTRAAPDAGWSTREGQ